MRSGSTFVSFDWLESPEGQGILAHLIDPQTGYRKIYGLLERPTLPPTVDQIHYKLFLSGKSGTGKSSLVSYLSGVGNWWTRHNGETPGIRTTVVYWPARIHNKIFLFTLSLWDSGDIANKKYGHITPVCRDQSDAGIFVFSFTDPASLVEIDQQLTRLFRSQQQQQQSSTILPIVVGLRYGGSFNNLEQVGEGTLANFESKWNLSVLRIQQPNPGSNPHNNEINGIMNIICDQLWAHSTPAII